MLIIALLVQLFLTMAVPALLAWFLPERLEAPKRLLLWGAIAFVGSQLLRWPVLQVATQAFAAFPSWAPAPRWQSAFNVIILAGSAGLLEECARYAVYRLAIPQIRRWAEGVIFGLGHGVAESLLLGTLVANTFISMLMLSDPQSDAWQRLPASIQSQVLPQVTAYWSQSWPPPVLGGIERLSALCVHMCLAVIVLQSVRSGHLRWLYLAIGLHALIDGLALVVAANLGIYAAESMIIVAACLSCTLLFALRSIMPDIPEKMRVQNQEV